MYYNIRNAFLYPHDSLFHHRIRAKDEDALIFCFFHLMFSTLEAHFPKLYMLFSLICFQTLAL